MPGGIEITAVTSPGYQLQSGVVAREAESLAQTLSIWSMADFPFRPAAK